MRTNSKRFMLIEVTNNFNEVLFKGNFRVACVGTSYSTRNQTNNSSPPAQTQGDNCPGGAE